MSENQHNFGTYGSFYFFCFRVTYEGLLVACEDEVKKRFSMIAALLMQFTQLTVNSICEIRNQSTHHNKMLAVDMFKFVISIRIAITVTVLLDFLWLCHHRQMRSFRVVLKIYTLLHFPLYNGKKYGDNGRFTFTSFMWCQAASAVGLTPEMTQLEPLGELNATKVTHSPVDLLSSFLQLQDCPYAVSRNLYPCALHTQSNISIVYRRINISQVLLYNNLYMVPGAL